VQIEGEGDSDGDEAEQLGGDTGGKAWILICIGRETEASLQRHDLGDDIEGHQADTHDPTGHEPDRKFHRSGEERRLLRGHRR